MNQLVHCLCQVLFIIFSFSTDGTILAFFRALEQVSNHTFVLSPLYSDGFKSSSAIMNQRDNVGKPTNTV